MKVVTVGTGRTGQSPRPLPAGEWTGLVPGWPRPVLCEALGLAPRGGPGKVWGCSLRGLLPDVLHAPRASAAQSEAAQARGGREGHGSRNVVPAG